MSYLTTNPSDLLRSVIFNLEPENFYSFKQYPEFLSVYDDSFVALYQEMWLEKLNYDKLPILDQIYYAAVFRNEEALKKLLNRYEGDEANDSIIEESRREDLFAPHIEAAMQGATATNWTEYINKIIDFSNLEQVSELVLESIRNGHNDYVGYLVKFGDDMFKDAAVIAIENNYPEILKSILSLTDEKNNKYFLAINMLDALGYEDFTFSEEEMEYRHQDAIEDLAKAKKLDDQQRRRLEIERIVENFAYFEEVYFTTPKDIDANRYYGSKINSGHVPYG